MFISPLLPQSTFIPTPCDPVHCHLTEICKITTLCAETTSYHTGNRYRNISLYTTSDVPWLAYLLSSCLLWARSQGAVESITSCIEHEAGRQSKYMHSVDVLEMPSHLTACLWTARGKQVPPPTPHKADTL